MTAPLKIFAPKNASSAPPAKNAAPSFTVKEARLIGRLGLSRDILRALRVKHLREGVDWQSQHRCIYLTEEAVNKIAEAAKLKPEELPATPRLLLTVPGCPDGTSAVLKAWRFWPQLKNRNVMEAYLRGTNPKDRRNIVRVRVRDSANFVPDMEIPARLVQSPDLYECTRPAPRSKGRW